MSLLKKRGIDEAKLVSRRKRKFRELERKAILGVIAGAAFIVIVTTIVAYFGLNVHDHHH